MLKSELRNKAHYRSPCAFTSLTLGDIKLFEVQLTTVSGRRLENTAARQLNNMSVAASPEHKRAD
jgi:hypothetical protein